jgi:hypothetical protein
MSPSRSRALIAFTPSGIPAALSPKVFTTGNALFPSGRTFLRSRARLSSFASPVIRRLIHYPQNQTAYGYRKSVYPAAGTGFLWFVQTASQAALN